MVNYILRLRLRAHLRAVMYQYMINVVRLNYSFIKFLYSTHGLLISLMILPYIQGGMHVSIGRRTHQN